jgi:hypothetical protein
VFPLCNGISGTYTYHGLRGNFTEAYQPLTTWPTWGNVTRCDRIFYRLAPDTPPTSASEFPLSSLPSSPSPSSIPASRSLQQMKVSNDGERRLAQYVIRFNASAVIRSGDPLDLTDATTRKATCASDHYSVEAWFSSIRSLDCSAVPCIG